MRRLTKPLTSFDTTADEDHDGHGNSCPHQRKGHGTGKGTSRCNPELRSRSGSVPVSPRNLNASSSTLACRRPTAWTSDKRES